MAMLLGTKSTSARSQRSAAVLAGCISECLDQHMVLQTHRQQLGYAKADFGAIKARVETLVERTVPALEAELIAAGAPWVPGGQIP